MKIKIKAYYLSLILLLAGSAGVEAQMTIGSQAEPHKGALLDLQQPDASTKMGLKLPVVSLDDATLYGLTSGDQTTATGMVVYNDNADIANGHGVGIYVWDGTNWMKVGVSLATPNPDGSTTIDGYKTYNYNGTIWMVQNSSYGTFSYAGTDGHYYSYDQAAGACPSGWELPTNEQWDVLKTIIDNDNSAGKWWTDYDNSARAGFYNGSSHNLVGSVGVWWSASAEYQYYSTNGSVIIGPETFDNNYCFSVRCVKK